MSDPHLDEERPCYYYRRVLIPGCMGAAMNGKRGCTCWIQRHRRTLEDRIEALEERIAKLERRENKP